MNQLPPAARLVGRTLTRPTRSTYRDGVRTPGTEEQYRLLAVSASGRNLFIGDVQQPSGRYAILPAEAVDMRSCRIHRDYVIDFSFQESPNLLCHHCGRWYPLRRPTIALDLRTDGTAVVNPGYVEVCPRCYRPHEPGTVMEVGR